MTNHGHSVRDEHDTPWQKDTTNNRKFTLPDHVSSDQTYDGHVTLRRLDKVERENIRWLWDGVIARGKITMLAGDPGLGKSFLTMDLAARASRGGPWPMGSKGQTEPMSVLVLSAEDDPGDTIRPRLEDAGADLGSVLYIESIDWPGGGKTTLPLLDRDAEAIALSLVQMHRHMQHPPGLVIIDPISAYLGKIDANNNADVRRVLGKLSMIAERFDVAILCITHLNKSQQSKLIYRSMGSLAFTAAARQAWLVAKDPNRPDSRVLVPIKSNIRGTLSGVSFTIQSDDEGRGRVEYARSPEGVTLEGLELDTANTSDHAAGGQQVSERDEASRFLRELLASGPVEAGEVIAEAERAGLSVATLRRAKSDLGVVSKRIQPPGEPARWVWTSKLLHSEPE